jgi:hypothetical protein
VVAAVLITLVILQLKPTSQELLEFAQPKVTAETITLEAPKSVSESPASVDQTTPVVEPVVKAPEPVPSGPAEWMSAAGISESDRPHVSAILGQESGWTLTATNYLGCIGLGQACPSGNKAEMLSKCPDWETNGACQMKVWNDYAIRRYGSWAYANEWKFCTGYCYNSHTGTTTNKHGEPWW